MRCCVVEYRFDRFDFLEVLDSSTEGSFIHDLELKEMYFSEKWKIRLGIENVPPKDIFHCINRIIHPEDVKAVHRSFLNAVRNKLSKAQVEFRAKTLDSGYVWILGQVKIIYDQKGKPVKYYGTHIDITNRKQMERSYFKSKEKYRSLIYSMDDMFCILEAEFENDEGPADFKLVEMNPAFEKQLGIKSSAWIGKSVKSAMLKFGDFLYDMLVKLSLTGEPGRTVYESKATGHTYLVKALSVADPDDRNMALLISDITRDIKIKEMEKTIKMHEELFANVSHELKTPLNVIFSANQLMEMYLKVESNNNSKKLLRETSVIKQNCYRFTKLINNIVDLSKVDAGFFKLNLKNENIVDIVESIVQSVAEYVKEKGVNIIFDTDVEEMIVACDALKIERVLLNLISNAIKFSDPGGCIFVYVLSRQDSVEIAVQDTGIGIDREQLDLIFNRFHQVDKSLSRNAEGTGIGLSLVKSIVEAHGGNISVESVVDEGSIFRFEIPARIIEETCEKDKSLKMNSRVELINVEFSDIYNWDMSDGQ